jgi:hypothetical protein
MRRGPVLATILVAMMARKEMHRDGHNDATRGGHGQALRCPKCGHLDPLAELDAAARREVFEEAERRLLQRLAGRARTGHGRERVA